MVRTRTRHVAAVSVINRFFAVVLVFIVSCGPGPTLSDNQIPLSAGAPVVTLYVEPEEGPQPVIQFINDARQTLDVAMYLFSDRPIELALEAATKRGVRVRVMFEEHPYGSGPGNTAYFQRLRLAGASVAWSPAEFKLSHDKYAVADRRRALVGTANWTTSAFARNREYLVVDDDATDVGQLSSLFEADWSRQKTTIDDPRLVISPTNSRAAFLTLIRSSRQNLDLQAEEMQDPEIEGALGVVAKNGVQVRVILPAPTGGFDANVEGRQKLAASGVEVRLLQSPYVHAKDLIVDNREAFVGSENISVQSLNGNREVGLFLADPAAISRLEETFVRDWAAASS